MSDTKKIIIIDDDESLRGLLVRRFQAEGFETVDTGDSNNATQLIMQELPDLVLLDIMMPGKSGMDVLAEMRQQVQLMKTPVMIMTNSSDYAFVADAMEKKVTVYIQKSMASPESIANEAKKLLGM